MIDQKAFHVDGCPGCAEIGDHEMRAIDDVWCVGCELPAVANYRNGSFILGVCALHLTLAMSGEESAIVAPYSGDDTIYCRLRGATVKIEECVASCPAPEQRAVCAFEFDPVSPQMAQYQAEGR